MKKILLVLSLILVLSLGACSNAPNDFVEREEYEALEQRVLELETTIDNLVTTTGLNGQTDYYVNDNGDAIYLSLNGYEMAVKEEDYLDKTKFPDYIWDLEGNYITVNDLGNLLSQKYFGVDSETMTGFQYKIRIYKPADMTNEDYIVRLSMMIIELSNYDFYTIDSPELYIEFATGGSQYIKVRMSLLVTDKYNLHPAIFWNSMLDTRIENFYYNVSTAETLYDDFILNDTFIGTVLDYK